MNHRTAGLLVLIIVVVVSVLLLSQINRGASEPSSDPSNEQADLDSKPIVVESAPVSVPERADVPVAPVEIDDYPEHKFDPTASEIVEPTERRATDIVLRNEARRQIRKFPPYTGYPGKVPGGSLENLLRTHKPKDMELTAEQLDQFEELVAETEEAVQEKFRGRYELELHAMERSIDSGSFAMIESNPGSGGEFAKFQADMAELYGAQNKDWINLQLSMGSVGDSRSMMLFVAKKNEPELFRAQEQLRAVREERARSLSKFFRD